MQIRDAVIESMKNIVANAPENYDVPVVQLERKNADIKAKAVELLREKLDTDYGI